MILGKDCIIQINLQYIFYIYGSLCRLIDLKILYIKICSKYALKAVFDTSKKKENKFFARGILFKGYIVK